jgi:very-short-patch-repair endonuclease
MSPRSRSSSVARPFHGVRTVDLSADSVIERCRSFEPVLLPGQFFSHATALALRGVSVPIEAVIHISVAFPRTPPRGRGVLGHSVRRDRWDLVDGLPVARAALAWRQSAAILDLEQLVVAADAVLGGARDPGGRPRPGAASVDQLRAETQLAIGSRGARNAAAALELARAGVGSPAETRLRLLVVAAGLREPVVDLAVPVGGGRVWHPDLSFPAERIAIEYEGDLHRSDRGRWRRDIARREAFEDAGWRVVRVTAADLRDPRELLDRLRRLLLSRAESQAASVDRAERHDSRSPSLD